MESKAARNWLLTASASTCYSIGTSEQAFDAQHAGVIRSGQMVNSPPQLWPVQKLGSYHVLFPSCRATAGVTATEGQSAAAPKCKKWRELIAARCTSLRTTLHTTT